MDRRSFLLGLGAAVCAPAIVRAASLMPVRRPAWWEVELPPNDWVDPVSRIYDMDDRAGGFMYSDELMDSCSGR